MDKTFCKRCGIEIWAPVSLEIGYCQGCEGANRIVEDFARIARVDAAKAKERDRWRLLDAMVADLATARDM